MKKASIAAAALALTAMGAQAQSSVQLMGTADLYAGRSAWRATPPANPPWAVAA